ncbi:leukotoxin LktA family filamentous adhesin [Stenotrophomonas nitritireducens]|uniref:leukotoxin LktA family filamentous adhesin n=1 Tax=Stenotrophomonas nitritireducens TaxID=83617 RepID=UPI00081C0160|nr:leukotoxin LktA family filamentous adhesin [Stenotrophomonas nitritireducens]
MNRIDALTKSASPLKTTLASDSRLRPAGLAVAISSVLGLAMPNGATMAANSVINVQDDAGKRTDTTVSSVAGGAITVTTATVKNGVAFNSFKDFNVAQNEVVNLVLPGANPSKQVNNLVNLVWDSKIYIDGTLNSLLESTGKVGGRVFFVDPMGMVVGKSGVLNVSSLTVATPTSKVMDDILAGGGSLNRLMAGTLTPEQISADGEVSIGGRINARNGVRVQARAIDVTGTILVEVPAGETLNGAFNLQRDDVAVNTGGDDSRIVLVDDGNGQIQLRAAAVVDTGLALSKDATATVTIGCDATSSGCVVGDRAALSGGRIELSALAKADSSYKNPDNTAAGVAAGIRDSLTDISQAGDLLQTAAALGAEKALSGQISFLRANTTARVEVKGNADLAATSGGIDLHASTVQAIDNSAAGKQYELKQKTDANGPVTNADGSPAYERHWVSLGAAYAQINATTEAIIRSGAGIRTDGALSVKADADTQLKLAAQSFATNNTITGFTAAISNVNVATTAMVEQSANKLSVGSVNVSAVNTASLDTAATAYADATGKVGLAGAVSLQDLDATATLARDVDAAGNVTVQAATVTSKNSTTSLVTAPPKEKGKDKDEDKAEDAGSSGDKLMEMVQSFAGKGIAAAKKKLDGDSGNSGNSGGGSPPPSPFRLGGAISYVGGSHTAAATVAAGTRINAGGNVVVDSQVIDAQIANHALSNIQGKGKSNDGSAFTLSGAITIADLEHEASTLVDSGAALKGAHVGLGSNVSLPRDFSALLSAQPKFGSFDEFKDSITNAKKLISDPSDLFTSYGSAKGSADSVALGGVISYFKAKNVASTSLASDARITTTAVDGNPWTAALDARDQTGKQITRSFDKDAVVRASTEITAIHAAGDLGLTLKRVSTGDGGTAVGGSVGYMDYDNSATALINDGAVINSHALEVAAENKETIVSLALQSGQGGSIGVSGTASALDLDSHTLAGVSNKATVTAKSVDVKANEDLFVWSVAGAVTMTDSLSVGASVAYQQMDTDTRAFIGAIPAGYQQGSSAAGAGSISTNALAVNATSEGLSGAVAAAGAMVSSKSQKEEDQKAQQALADKQNGENPAFFDSLKSRASDKVAGLESMAGGLKKLGGDKVSGYFDKAKGLLGSKDAPQSDSGPINQPSFGVAVSGSVTVNRIRQNTKADITSATVHGLDTASKLDIAAINKTLLVSISGAISITKANSDNSNGSAAIAGGVAYSDIANDTHAGLVGSTLDRAGDVSITARNENEQVNVGLGVGVNASSDQSTAVAAAVSATVAMSKSNTTASLAGSTLGNSTGSYDVAVKAVNESKIGNGGGALYVGGKAGMGIAVTYADIADKTTASISGGSISKADDVQMIAADASRIIAAAAAGGVSKEANSVGLAGSVVINQIANQTTATINGGADIAFAGALDVYAGTARIADVRATDDGCSSAMGMDYCGTAVGAVTADANADSGSSSDTQVSAIQRNQARSSIIAVAGMAQVSDSNAGVAFGYNSINNSHVASVAGANISRTSGASGGDIAITAEDHADILAVSAGLGVSTGKFAGVGSASYNQINNTTAALVGIDAAGLAAATALDGKSITLDASDAAYIASLSGAVTVGSKVAVGAALTINEIASKTKATARGAQLTASGDVTLDAQNQAKILSGAIAAGAAGNVAVQGSVAWSTIGNNASADLIGGSVDAANIAVGASNSSKMHTLSGAVAGAGTAAVGAAINVGSIADTTHAGVDGTAVSTGKLDVKSVADSTIKTLAIAGAAAGTAAISASNSSNLIDNTTDASIKGLQRRNAGVVGDVTVNAQTTGAAYSLAGALAGAGSVAVGAASSVNIIGGDTTASVRGSQLDNASGLAVEAGSSNLVRTAAVSGAGAGSVAVGGSVTTNIITSNTSAQLQDTRLDSNVAGVRVHAKDGRSIDSLAGAAAVAGSVGVGAAIAFNQIGGSTSASLVGGSNGYQLHAKNVEVSAQATNAAGNNGANIRTIAAGLGGGGAVGGAASVAVNLMEGQVSARIADGADVVADGDVTVRATQQQGIDVLTGSVAVGGTAAGIGLGTVVNLMTGKTLAQIDGAGTKVSALGWNGASGVLVDAATRQVVNTLGVSQAVSFAPISGQTLSVMAGVDVIGGSTEASITSVSINQHDLSGWVGKWLPQQTVVPGAGGGQPADFEEGGNFYSATALADDTQSVKVKASSDVQANTWILGAAAGAGGSASGAASSMVLQTATKATVRDANLASNGDILVDARGRQSAQTTVMGIAGGLVGGAGTGVVNVFSSNTEASLSGGRTEGGSLSITADNQVDSSIVAGAGAFGAAAAGAGVLVVNMAQTQTGAHLGRAGVATNVDVQGKLDVSARTAAQFDSTVVSGALAGGGAVAGMAQFQQIANTTQADIVDATVVAGRVGVSAREELAVNATSGVAAASLGQGVGAAANITLLGSKVAAGISGGSIRSGGAVDVTASALRNISMITATAGIGLSTGIGGAASVLLSGVGDIGSVLGEVGGTKAALDDLASGPKLDASVTGDAALAGKLDNSHLAQLNGSSSPGLLSLGGKQDQVLATIKGASVDAGSVGVTASNLLTASNIAGVVAAGGLGAGGAVAYSGMYGQTSAAIENGQVNAGNVQVSATSGSASNQPSSTVKAVAGSAGLVGIGAAVAWNDFAQTTTASVSGNVNATRPGGALSVLASDGNSAKVDATGAAVGALAAGAVIAHASRDATVTASVGNNAKLSGFNQVALNALHSGSVSASGTGAVAGLAGAANAVVVLARDSSSVSSVVGEDASIITKGTGVAGPAVGDGSSLQVTASSDATVRATGLGVTVSAGAAVGAVVVDAQAKTDVLAALGNKVNVSGDGNVNIKATRGAALGTGAGVYAEATAGAGGIYFAANAAVANAGDNSVTKALVGNDVVIGSRGDFTVAADSSTRQDAQATGITIGGLALGAAVANASSNTQTIAAVGDRIRGTHANTQADPLQMMGKLAVTANGNDSNLASTFAGSGGLISGAASAAGTTGTSLVSASIGSNAGNGKGILADSITVAAKHQANYGGSADSTNAAVAGASGSKVRNVVDSTVSATLGSGARLFAGQGLGITADNLFYSALDGAAVQAAAGGVINGSAALLETQLTGRTTASVGDNVTLQSGVANKSSGNNNLDIVARTKAVAVDKAQLSTGGAIQVAVVDTRMDADFSNQVSVGNSAKLASLGYLNLGTTTTGSLNSQALVNTWGLAAVGSARSKVEADVIENVNVGTGATLSSVQNAYLSAGKDGTALLESNLLTNAGAEGYVRGLVAIPTVSADAATRAQMGVSLGAGSTLSSSGDIYVGAWGDYFAQRASGRATGYQLGFIPVTINRSSPSGAGAVVSNVAIDGKVIAGTATDVRVGINSNFSCSADIGIGYACMTIAQLKQLDSSFDPGEVVNDNDQVVLIDDIYAAGADVYLKGTNIRIGSTGSVAAHGAPSVDIVNDSAYHLAFGNIYIPDYAGGNVLVAGTVNSGYERISGSSSGAKPHININGNYTQGNGSSILQMGVVNSIGADVRYESKAGSIVSGPVYAASFNTFAPNGTFTFKNRNQDKNVTSSEGLWASYLQGLLGSAYGNADLVAGLLANLQYKGSATNTEQLNNNLLKQPGDANYGGGAIIVYGACLPHVGGSRCGSDQPGYGSYTTFPYNYKNSVKIPTVAYVDTLSGSASYSQNGAIAADTSAIRAREVNITARYIDINGTIEAGAGIDWSLQISDDLNAQNWLAWADTQSGVLSVPSSMVRTIGSASNLISVKYDTAAKRFIVDDVNASGGGKVMLDGSIVSTTNKGKINVTSGFGQVKVDVGLGRDVQLSGMNVATGQDGVVQIIDRLKTSLDGKAAYSVWYVQRAGEQAKAYDNSICGAACSTWETANSISNVSSYNPKAGMRYRWSMEARIGRTIDWASYTAGTWKFLNSSGGEASGAQRWITGGGAYYQANPAGADMEWNYSGSFSNVSNRGVSYGCGVVQSGCNFGFPSPSGGLHWNPSREGGDGGYETWYRYSFPQNGQLKLNASVRADNPISIGFVSRDKGSVDVSVVSDLYLNGTINNKAGTTTLSSSQGSIIQGNDRATLYAQNLVLNAKNGIGAIDGKAVEAALSNGGSVKATTNGGDIALNVHSDADVRLIAGNAQSGYGDVSLIASGNINGIAGDAVSIIGSNVNLTSTTGSIGKAGAAGALVIAAHESNGANNQVRGGNVYAKARDNVSLVDVDGDFWVGGVTATNGDVYLEARNGSLLDGAQRDTSKGLSDSQIEDIRKRLKLDGSGVTDTVATYERQVESLYAEYLNLYKQGGIVGAAFVPNAALLAAYRARAELAAGGAQTDAQVTAFVADLYQQMDATFGAVYGANWAAGADFTAPNGNFQFTLDTNSNIYKALADRAHWDEGQLQFAINASALEPAKSTGNNNAAPTISGANVTLRARDSLGKLADSVDVNYARVYAGNLDGKEALALAMATSPGDVQLIGRNGQVITIDQLKAMSEAELQAGPVDFIRIKQTAPLYVKASGTLTAKAGGSAYLQSTGDLTVAALDVTGNAALGVAGNLVGATPDTVLNVGGNLKLEADGSIGSNIGSVNESLLGLKLGGTLSANAGGALGIRQHGGNLVFDSLYSGDRMRLDVRDGSLLAASSSVIGLRSAAGGVQLTARDDIRAVDGGALSLQLDNGRLDGQAGGDILISSPKTALNIGTLQSGRNMQIGAAANLVALALRAGGSLRADAGGVLYNGVSGNLQIDDVQARDDITLAAAGDMTVGAAQSSQGNALLVATGDMDLDTLQAKLITMSAGGQLQLQAGGLVKGDGVTANIGSLKMDDGARMQAGSQLDVTTAGDMQLGQLQVTGAGSAGAMNLAAGGRIVGNGDGQVNLLSVPATQVNINAQTGIGQNGERLSIAGGVLNGGTRGGDALLDLIGSARIGVLAADAGSLDITGSADISFDSLKAGNNLHVVAGALQGGDLQAGQQILAGSGGAINLRDAVAGSSMQLAASGALAARQLQAGTGMALSSGNTLDVQQLTAGGDLAADAVGTLSIAQADVTGNADVDGQTDVVLGTANVGQALTANAATTLTATRLNAGGNARLSSGGNSTVGTFDGKQDLSITAGGDLALTTGTVDGDATLSSAGATSINSLSVQGTLDASSVGAMMARTLASGGNAALSSGNTLDVQQLTVGGDLAADAVGTLSIAQADVTGNADVDGQADVVLGTANVGQALTANAATDLTATSLNAGGNARLSSGGNSTVGTFDGRHDLSVMAGADISVTKAVTGRAMYLDAGQSIQVGTAQIGTDGVWKAGGDISADTVTTGCGFDADAGGVISLGSLQAGCGIALASNGTLAFDQLQAGDDISLVSRAGSVLGGQVDAGGSLRVAAAGDIAVNAAEAGRNITASSGGTQQWGRYAAGGDARLQSQGDVAVGSGVSGGAQSIISGGSIRFDRVAAGSTVRMDAQGGSLAGGNLQAASGSLAARDQLSLSQGLVDTRLNLAADSIQAHVAQSAAGQGPLTTTLTGYHNGVARKVVVEVDPRDAWLIDQLKAVDAQLATRSARASIGQGYVERTMALNTAQMRVFMDNTNPTLRPVDVQLIQLDKTFRLAADGRFLVTDAYVENFGDGFRVTSPNYNRDHVDSDLNYFGEGALRYMGRMLQLDPAYDGQAPVRMFDVEMGEDVIATHDAAVNFGAPN